MNRVVITGAGVVCPLGDDVTQMMARLGAGASGVRVMDSWNRYGTLRCQLGAPVALRGEKAIPRKMRRTMSRMSIFAVQAAEQAIAQARLDAACLSDGRTTGCVMGSTTGSPHAITASYETLLGGGDYAMMGGPDFFRCLSHTVTLNLAQYFGIQGTALATSAACASGLQALGSGYEVIRSGRHPVMLCGGADELHETTVGSFDILFAASTGYNDRPAQTPRPFDSARDGLVCGEGAGVVVLEEREHARRRGATILGEILGYHTCSSGSHVTLSDPEAMARCITAALSDADCEPHDIGYVSAHATGTTQGDAAEATAIASVFGDAVPVSSLKGHLGHTLAASGAIELIASLHMMHGQTLLPTRNLITVDAQCAGVQHVTAPRPHRFARFLKNSFAFGGINAALVCAQPESTS